MQICVAATEYITRDGCQEPMQATLRRPRVMYSVARAGQMGYHHRTEMNKKVYRISKVGDATHKGATDFDNTDKGVTPLGGFPHYGNITEDFVMVKGSVAGTIKRCVTLRQSCFPQTSRRGTDQDQVHR